MNLNFKIGKPGIFSPEEKEQFLQLLREPGQVENSNLERINASTLICIAFVDDSPIGIGAIKNVVKSSFDYAKVTEMKEKFDHELGYLFLRDGFKGWGIGKMISWLLMQKLGKTNVFATTDLSVTNSMKFILEKLGFIQLGNPYIGRSTGKIIGLFVKIY